MHDFYAILGVTPEATRADIERAYRQRITPFLQNPRPTAEDAESAMIIEEAHGVLSDSARREVYDRSRGVAPRVAFAPAAAPPPRPAPLPQPPPESIPLATPAAPPIPAPRPAPAAAPRPTAPAPPPREAESPPARSAEAAAERVQESTGTEARGKAGGGTDEEYIRVSGWFSAMLEAFASRKFERVVELAGAINASSYASGKASLLEAIAYQKLKKPLHAREAATVAINSFKTWPLLEQAVRDITDAGADAYMRLFQGWRPGTPGVARLRQAEVITFAALAPLVVAVALSAMRLHLPALLAFVVAVGAAGYGLMTLHRGRPLRARKLALIVGAGPGVVFLAVFFATLLLRPEVQEKIATRFAFDPTQHEEVSMVPDALVLRGFEQVSERVREMEKPAPVATPSAMRLLGGGTTGLRNQQEQLNEVVHMKPIRKEWHIMLRSGQVIVTPHGPQRSTAGMIVIEQADGKIMQVAPRDVLSQRLVTREAD